VTWRYLRTGRVPHQGHGIEYEAPEPPALPANESVR
jgi:hypothetical protein